MSLPSDTFPPALSTCWNSSRHQDGEAMLAEIRDLGFERAELSHGIRYSLYPGVLAAVEKSLITVSSVHNFCPVPAEVLRPSPNCYEFSDERASIRERAVHFTLQTLDFALRVKAPAVVLHLGWAGPRGITRQLEKAWLQGRFLDRAYVRAKVAAVAARRKRFETVYSRVRPCLEQIIPAARERGLRLGFEIREDYAEFPDEIEMERLLTDFPDETAGYWHDFGHAARKEHLGWHDHAATLAKWSQARPSRLLGCHIHDCLPPNRDHRPLGTGTVDFPSLLPLLPSAAIRVFELSPRVEPGDVRKTKELWHRMEMRMERQSAVSDAGLGLPPAS